MYFYPGYLAIDNTTGDLTLTKTLKHEANNTHTLVVMVTDGGSPQLNSSVTVSLVIVSRNKHAPELPKDLHVLVNEVSILEKKGKKLSFFFCCIN